MKITILGCSGGYATSGEATSGYLIQFSDKNILVDCGSGVLSRLLSHISLEQLDAIILTHLHFDHCSDMGVLRYALQMNESHSGRIYKIPVYLPKEPEAMYNLFAGDPHFLIHTMEENGEFELFGAKVQLHQTQHPVKTFGLRITYQGADFAYSSDTNYFPELAPLFSGVDLAIMDCGALDKFRATNKMHMTPEECYAYASICKIKRVVLSHFLPYYDIKDIIAEAEHCGSWNYTLATVNGTFQLEERKDNL